MESERRMGSGHTAGRCHTNYILMLTLNHSSASPLAVIMMLLLTLPGVVLGVQVKELSVPEPAVVGRTARLECNWSSQDFYSIRWYKDEENIFTIIPETNVKTDNNNNVYGVTVDVDASNEYMLVLHDVMAATAGEYKCEVMGEKPHFVTKYQTKVMTVAEVPSGVELTGLAAHYRVGDLLNVTCTVRNSRPAAVITFYIDDKEVAVNTGLVEMGRPEHGTKLDTYTTWAQLRLRLNRQHVPRTSLRCIGRISSVPPLEALRVILVDDAQPNHASLSRGCSSTWRCEMLLPMSIAIIYFVNQFFLKYS